MEKEQKFYEWFEERTRREPKRGKYSSQYYYENYSKKKSGKWENGRWIED